MHFTHGGTGTRLYSTYRNMLERCNNPKNKRYKHYGGRGIKVCDEWANGFEAFKKWALTSGYSDTLTLDRINPDKDYCPENCRWATMEQQQNNRTNNHKITYNGETKTLAEWSKARNIKYATLERRLNAYKWDIKRALNF